MRIRILAVVFAVILPVIGLAILSAGASEAAASLPRARAVPAAARADTFSVDPMHSSAVFRIRHLSASWFWGRFNRVSGSFRLDE